MNNQPVIAAIGLVWPEVEGGRGLTGRHRDGRRVLRERAMVRALSVQLRTLGYVALAVALAVMFSEASSAAAAVVILVASALLVFEFCGGAPVRQRPRRIVGDARSLLTNNVVTVPDARRAGRIISTRPDFDIPSLPPDRPRTRISERRPGPQDDMTD